MSRRVVFRSSSGFDLLTAKARTAGYEAAKSDPSPCELVPREHQVAHDAWLDGYRRGWKERQELIRADIDRHLARTAAGGAA